MCFWGMIPPVPPTARERCQLETRVRCTPTSFETFEGPPNSVMMRFAGSMTTNVAKFATQSSDGVAKTETDSLPAERYTGSMLGDWVRDALQHANMSGAELARRLTDALGRSIDRAAVSKMQITRATEKTKPRAIAADEMIAISEITGFPLPKEAAPAPPRQIIATDTRVIDIPVVGIVEAGAFRQAEDIYQDDPVMIQAPADPDFPHARITAWDVAGDSMNALKPRPIFPGDRVIGINFEDLDNRVPLRDGMVVVVEQVRDGGHIREWSVKQIELYDDRIEFHPRSTSAKHKPIVVKRDLWADDGREVSILALVRRVTNEFKW